MAFVPSPESQAAADADRPRRIIETFLARTQEFRDACTAGTAPISQEAIEHAADLALVRIMSQLCHDPQKMIRTTEAFFDAPLRGPKGSPHPNPLVIAEAVESAIARKLHLEDQPIYVDVAPSTVPGMLKVTLTRVG